MRPSITRKAIALTITALLAATSAGAFNFPLSPESIRDAYFLGQRRDNSTTLFLDTYNKHLPAPKIGPYISDIRFLTPFAQLVRLSSEHSTGYSAQQAEQEHRGHGETVEVQVEIQFTQSYGAILTDPQPSRSSQPTTYRPRPASFWTDFQVQVLEANKLIDPATSDGKPNYTCNEDGGCILIGATITLEFPAESFHSNSATIAVLPPEGNHVSIDFDLNHLR
jgi:hypothetical protein